MQRITKHKISALIAFFLIASLLFSCVSHQLGKNNSGEYKNGMVVSANAIASEVGIEILKKGGNAVDAAVAVQFALAVVYPNAGNIGGGGFMIYRSAKGDVSSLDFREKAASLATRDMYLDATGMPITDKSLYGQLAAGVPGSVAGMAEAHQKYGKLKWADLIEPAIRLAGEGFKLSARQARELNGMKARFQKLNPLGTALLRDVKWAEGDLLVQKELANTLAQIAKKKVAMAFMKVPLPIQLLQKCSVEVVSSAKKIWQHIKLFGENR
jgi:gamma-glutamyltranspeptidase/glutathione hydrolase